MWQIRLQLNMKAHVINLGSRFQMRGLSTNNSSSGGAGRAPAAFKRSSLDVICAATTTAKPIVPHMAFKQLMAVNFSAASLTAVVVIQPTRRPWDWSGWDPGCGYNLIWCQLCGWLRQRSRHEARAEFLLHRVIFLWFSMKHIDSGSYCTCDSEIDCSHFTCFQPVCTYRQNCHFESLLIPSNGWLNDNIGLIRQ